MTIPFDLWGQRGYPNVDIVGESHYAGAIRSLLGDDFKPGGAEVMATAVLMPEPANEYDPNAVGVRVDGLLVGYLPRDEARRYAPVLGGLVARGLEPQVRARIWGAEWEDYDNRGTTFRGSVRLDLAEPHLIVPVNLPPGAEHQLLPHGSAIQVSGEEQHLDALVPFLRPEGECWVYATLHEIVEQSARTSRTVVEVRIGGNRVGRLTPKMSGDLLPAIHHLGEHGRTTAARALVKGNRIKAEVVLYALRAHELRDSWLRTTVDRSATYAPATDRRHEHAAIPPPPTGVRFVVPVEWPQPPHGWTPPAGWRPDPSWQPAPEGWQWWVPVWD